MLQELIVENFVLIDTLRMTFDPHLNILSGETGAGKSILIDAMGFVLGQKPDKSLIRSGSEQAVVQAVFQVSGPLAEWIGTAHGIRCEDGQLLIQRELFSSGRSTIRINGLIATASALEEIGDRLVDFHGQHQHQTLLHPKNHLDMLDAFIGPAMTERRRELRRITEALRSLELSVKDSGTDARALQRRLEALEYEIKDIEGAALAPGEDDLLEMRFETLRNTEEILLNLHGACELLNGEDTEALTVLGGLQECHRRVARVSAYNTEIAAFEEGFSEIQMNLAEMARDLRRYAERISFDEAAYQETGDRLNRINQLKRKYGATVEEILEYLQRAQENHRALQESMETLERYAERRQELLAEYRAAAQEASTVRRDAAAAFEEAVIRQLRQLNLPNAVLTLQLTERKDPWETGVHTSGMDLAELMISMNPGEPMKPLKFVASGGELSRLMLALKVVLSGADAVATLVFDEIDSGISGKTAAIVGEKLVEVSSTHQVLCISHLAQICALGDRHYLIEKQTDGEKTVTGVRRIEGEARVQELSRILGGALITESSSRAAEELLKEGAGLRRKRPGQ